MQYAKNLKQKIASAGAVAALAAFCAAGAALSVPGTETGTMEATGADAAMFENPAEWQANIPEGYRLNEDVKTYLFIGVDNKEAENKASLKPSQFGQADVVMLAAVNSRDGTVKVINIPRDAMVNVKRYELDGSVGIKEREQLCLQYAYGKDQQHCARLVEDVITQQIFPGIRIDGYYALDFAGMAPVLEEIAPISMTMEDDYEVTDEAGNHAYEKGMTYELDAAQAQHMIQYRDVEVSGSCMERTKRQMNFIRCAYPAVKEKVQKDPASMAEILKKVSGVSDTDIKLHELLLVALEIFNSRLSLDDGFIVLPGEIGEEVSFWDDLNHNTYELDMEAARKIMTEIWYVPL